MGNHTTRRDFLAVSATLAAASGALLPPEAGAAPSPPVGPIKVLVWDERQPAQRTAYTDFLGNQIAGHLRSEPGLSVESVGLDDPGRGLSPGTLGEARVLVWWGHVRNKEIEPEVGRAIVDRIKAGTLGLIALHSAHWSTPFVEAMNERARSDALKAWGLGGDKVEIREIPPPQRYTTPKPDARVTPCSTARKLPVGVTQVDLHLPICCFPAYEHHGKPSFHKVLKPDHPIAQGIPRHFELPETEMYDEPFHVPEPDDVIFEERWTPGQWFRSGMTWSVGRGQVFFYRPGHETYPVYKQSIPLKIVANAVRWVAPKPT